MEEILIIIQQSQIYDWRNADQVVIRIEQTRRKLLRRKRLPQITFTPHYTPEIPYMPKKKP